MTHWLDTADQVLEFLGGTSEVGRLTRRAPSNVSNWRIAGKFPPGTFFVMWRALRAKDGGASPDLWSQVGDWAWFISDLKVLPDSHTNQMQQGEG